MMHIHVTDTGQEPCELVDLVFYSCSRGCKWTQEHHAKPTPTNSFKVTKHYLKLVFHNLHSESCHH